MGEQGNAMARVDTKPSSLTELGAVVDTSDLSVEQEAFLESVAREMEAAFTDMVENMDEFDEHRKSGIGLCEMIEDSPTSLDKKHAYKRNSIRTSAIYAAAMRQHRFGRR